MSLKDAQQIWEEYKERELGRVLPVLAELGFALEDIQPHLGGERYLMRAVTTAHGRKLILLGRRASDDKRVVIKATSDLAGTRELERERECRVVLGKINFAYQVFFSPEEILFTRRNGLAISVQAFIEQARPFLERPLEEQFALALKAFKAQEGAHATTWKHHALIQKTFDTKDASDYLQAFKQFSDNTAAQEFLQKNLNTIEQYCGFLTHTDFVPHNFRVVGSDIYLLDHSSLRFGNKYEGWARFINFMLLYNPPLERALVQYVRDNRAPEESLSLRLMRIYRLGEIIWYYRDKLAVSSGDLLALNQTRVDFWSGALQAPLQDTTVSREVIAAYQRTRDSLRSEEEKLRQIGLH